MIAQIVLAGALLLAGQDAVDVALQDARSLGYTPCSAEVVDAREGWKTINGTEMPENVAGWAAWPEAFRVCQVGLTPETVESADPEWLPAVARHEVCHLAVGYEIDRDTSTWELPDRHHDAPQFKECMAKMTEHVQAKVVVEGASTAPPGSAPVEVLPTVGIGNGGVTGVAEYEKIVNGATDEDLELCLELQEVKPWIDWDCGGY